MRRFFTHLYMVVLGLTAGLAFAESFTVPSLTGPVVDAAGMLGADSSARLSAALNALRQETGTQITVLTVPTLAGLEIEQASIQVVDEWKLGSRKEDRGLLLIIAKSERRVRIEVGQGLEGDLPDAYARRIIDEVIVPLFKEGSVDDGVVLGVYEIIKKTDPSFEFSKYFSDGSQRSSRVEGNRRARAPLHWFIVLMIIASVVARAFFRPYRTFGSVYRRGSWGGWGGGSGGWGSGGGFGGGGGWSGGGGGFSGGGSSGSW